ncbi:ABC transporter ATP-binding protein [Micrococcales bacterium 31B]|nr:ABC transporter ATP-binding protein [Micrococcales bacterium 31B]
MPTAPAESAALVKPIPDAKTSDHAASATVEASEPEPEPAPAKPDVLVRFTDVSKDYVLFKNHRRRLLGVLFGKGKSHMKKASRHLDFEIKRGESVAIFGRNGAGKSTLLKMVTGVTYPTTGTVEIHGKVGALLELTTGFENEFSGRENIYLKAAIMGLQRKDVAAYEDEIVDFAELEEYIDQPVSTYSSGMRARLGFAITALIEPEILVVDEALSVGDAKFNAKCQKKLDELHARDDLTVLFVTHSESTARKICERGIVLEKGGMIFDGSVDDAISAYRASL